MSHGTRQCYQRGCRERICIAANAYYVARWRYDKAHGKPRLGSLVDAKPAWKHIESLRIEGLSYGAIALRLGLRWPMLQLCTDQITLRNYLKVRRLYRTLMTEDSAPPDAAHP